MYHGCPTEFAELMVKEGPKVPYTVEDTARYVARVYDLSWMEFRPWAFRAHEVVKRLSMATAPVACRWAWSFPLGEILTNLNAHARMFKESKKVAREQGISVDDAYELISRKAIKMARGGELRYTSESAPDILGLPDKLALRARTGALVEFEVDARALPDYAVIGAQNYLEELERGESERELLLDWNHSYKDFKIAPGNIKSARIIIRDMYSWEQDVIEDYLERHVK